MTKIQYQGVVLTKVSPSGQEWFRAFYTVDGVQHDTIQHPTREEARRGFLTVKRHWEMLDELKAKKAAR